MSGNKVSVGDFEVGNDLPFMLIGGPCLIESKSHAVDIAGRIAEICSGLGINYVYKSSFDKANRTSITSPRGPGLTKGLEILSSVKQEIGCPVLTDVHTEEQCRVASEVVDILQIPALLCRQTDLLIAAAETGRVVNIKKGQFMAPHDMKSAADKVREYNNDKVLLTERGFSFGYNNLVSDMRSLKIMSETAQAPVIFDATHSVQQPSGQGEISGGKREFVPVLARASMASTPIAGIFAEIHEDPDTAPSDKACMLKLKDLSSLLEQLLAIDKIMKPGVYAL